MVPAKRAIAASKIVVRVGMFVATRYGTTAVQREDPLWLTERSEMPKTGAKQAKTNGGERRVNDGFSGVDAVERALSMLDAFGDGTPALALKDLADRTGLTKSTILRLNVSLERFGYLVRDSDGNYRLGPTLWQLGALFRQNLDLREVVVPVLDRIVAETKESASFYVLRGKNGVCLYRVNSPRMARDHVEEGEIIPLGVGASGHVLQAFANPRSKGAVQIMRDRIYVSKGERDPDVSGISAPILGPDRELIGAVSISGLTNRFTTNQVRTYSVLMRDAADEIEHRMGAHGP